MKLKITDIESFTVAIPFKAPILSAFGVSYPARIRTFIRVHTNEGITGLGETGPGALNYVNRDSLLGYFEKYVKPIIVGENPFDHQHIKRKMMYSKASIAVEIACSDIMAKVADVPLYRLLGGNGFCEKVPVSGYCFFRAANPNGEGAVTLDNYVEHCLAVQADGGYKTLKMKFGAHHPSEEVPLAIRLREAVCNHTELRIDPNGCWSVPTALRVLKQLEAIDLQYIEEPTRADGPADGTLSPTHLRTLRMRSQTPIAADHCYMPDQLAQLIRHDAADVVLADVFGAGGIASTVNFCRTAASFGLGLALHSGTELGVGQVAKLHIHAALSDSILFAGDTIYGEYVDGVLVAGKLQVEDGMMAVPQQPGLGVELDDDKLSKWEFTALRQQYLDDFWDEVKASLGISYAQMNLLVNYY